MKGKPISHTRHLVLKALWDMSVHGVYDRGAQVIANHLGITDDTVFFAFRGLQEEGALSKTRLGGGGHRYEYRPLITMEDYGTPASNPHPGYNWTEKSYALLDELWPDHTIGTKEIGRRLGFGEDAKNAVIGKARRRGLPARPSPIAVSSSPRPTRVARPSPPAPMVARPFQKPVVVLLPPVRPQPVPIIPKATRAPGKDGCRYPMWGDRSAPTHVYCDLPTVDLGSPWCAEHRKRCFNRVTLTARADAA